MIQDRIKVEAGNPSRSASVRKPATSSGLSRTEYTVERTWPGRETVASRVEGAVSAVADVPGKNRSHLQRRL